MKNSIKILFGLLLFTSVLITGCRKEFAVTEPGKVNSMSDLKVPTNFDWQTTREVNLNIGLNLTSNQSKYTRISVFDGDPYNGGQAVFYGSAANDFPMMVKVRIPTSVTKLYFQVNPSEGSSQIVTADVSDNIAFTFTENTGGVKSTYGTDTGPDCSAYDYLLNGSGSTTISDGKTHAVTIAYNGSVNVVKGTLKICGTFTGSISMGDNHDNSTVVISSMGTATLTSLSKDDNSVLSNYGVLVINSNFTPKVLVQNFGEMTVNGQYNMNGNDGNLINTGTLHINSHWNVINAVTNNGSIEVSGDMNCNNSTFYNSCQLIVHGFFHLNNCEFTNQTGYIKCYDETKIQGGQSFMLLRDNSMISTKDLTLNADVLGEGLSNEIKVTNDIRIDGPNKVNGDVEVSQTTGVLQNGGSSNFINGATLVSFSNIVHNISISGCNPEGTNPPNPCPDSDGDGVDDCNDACPNNPDCAYINVTTGTVVYEDLWPGKGDYDMNDLVNYYKYKVYSNAQNKVTSIVAKFYVRAAGAGLKNGFGFQFNNLTPSQIASVTGSVLNHGYIALSANGTESGQSKAVVIAFDNTYDVVHPVSGAGFFNTERNTGLGTADTVTIVINLSTPLSTSVIGTPPYNPFLIKGMDREVEIHLPDYIPTSLANPGYFGVFDDNSNPGIGRFYKTSTNLPWALNLPVTFDYPFEYTDITWAYNYFAAWAQSGGTQHTDWYKDLSGYRNADNIYH